MVDHPHTLDDPYVVIQQKDDEKEIFCTKCACRLALVPEWIMGKR